MPAANTGTNTLVNFLRIMLSPRLLFKKGLLNPYGFVLLLVSVNVVICFLTRLSLLLFSAKTFDWTVTNVLGVFSIGFIYDLVVSSFISIPFVLHIWFTNENIYSKKWVKWMAVLYILLILVFSVTQLVPSDFNPALHKAVIGFFILRFFIFLFLAYKGPAFRQRWRKGVLYADFFIVVFLLVFNAVSEWFFWNEFSGRYNFIAVDYLVYTNEVIGNIRESYPLGFIISAVVLIALSVTFLLRKNIRQSQQFTISFRQRTVTGVLLLAFPLSSYFLVDGRWDKFSDNYCVNQLAGNGLFEFGEAFNANELDFYRFYTVIKDEDAFRVVRNDLATPYTRFVNDNPFSIERDINYPQPEKKMNVVLISVESLSANFMKAFGSHKNITPNLDSLSQHSIFFTNLYASGTRTVRGLEALTLSIPPTPGQSVVKRKDNQHLFSLGSVFRSKGYKTQYIYGGYSYFDNMNRFFGNNGYEVIDRSALSPGEIHYANIWGVADEDLFTLAMHKLDENYTHQQPFFTHIMTVSNHRPYTYPDGRIDIPSSKQWREGAVKYTDYAIGKFIREATTKPWFNNTIFVIVADHCASSAGNVELPVTGYHIPMLIYSPANLPPLQFNRLTAQIDIAPTILGLLHFDYRSKFFGQDIFALPAGKERVFISTYQGLGYVKDNQLVIQSPVKQLEEFVPDFISGDAKKTAVNDSLTKQAIAYYQCASWLLKNRKYGDKY